MLYRNNIILGFESDVVDMFRSNHRQERKFYVRPC